MKLLKHIPVILNIAFIFSYSGLSGIVGSDGKQKNTYDRARGPENSISFHEQTR